MLNNHHKNIATFIHLSTFSRFLIPFGNFIGPIILWMANKEKSDFVDTHGKQAINFQMSILLYALVLGMISVPFFVFNLFDGFNFIDIHPFDGVHINISEPSPLLYLGGGLGVLLELVFIVIASLKARDGELYHYPLTINFLK